MSTARLGEHSVELIDLALGTTKSAQTLLGKTTGALVETVLEQFHAATLIGSKAGNLADDVANKMNTLGSNLLQKISQMAKKKMSANMNLDGWMGGRRVAGMDQSHSHEMSAVASKSKRIDAAMRLIKHTGAFLLAAGMRGVTMCPWLEPTAMPLFGALTAAMSMCEI